MLRKAEQTFRLRRDGLPTALGRVAAIDGVIARPVGIAPAQGAGIQTLTQSSCIRVVLASQVP